ncbi:CRISPR-associated endonuclease Cas2 [Patescibacteria group bacterium]|nr:CRISPR-associated endonuclease Cas2 [Patescibacteria group bacterium]
MILVSYDISNDKTRTKLSKFLNKFGRKLQYSVYEIHNSPRILQNVLNEIESKYKKKFEAADSVVIWSICEGDKKKTIRYGCAQNEEKDVVVFS